MFRANSIPTEKYLTHFRLFEPLNPAVPTETAESNIHYVVKVEDSNFLNKLNALTSECESQIGSTNKFCFPH